MGKKNSNQTNARRKPRKRRFFKLKWLLYLFIFGLLLCGVGYIVFQVKTKPYKERAATYDLDKIDDVEVASKILDRKGREIGRIFVENRDKISIKEVPQIMVDALIAGEDQRFFEHDGVDRIGVARAVWLNFEADEQTQGASTITQQLARNAFHLKEEAKKHGESGMERKAVEAFLAQRIEERYGKFEILEFYLNRIPFGSGFYGIRSAALGYFGKEPSELTVSECASLVGCIRNPLKNSPLNDLKMNESKRNQVLGRMVIEGTLTQAEHDKFIALPVVVNPKPIRRGTSHLYERIARKVREHLGEDALTEGGFIIHTTIDLDVQSAMEKNLLDRMAAVETHAGYQHPRYADYRKEDGKPNYLQGAGLMTDNETGAVIAYVGGRDFTHTQYDFVESGRRPIGTAFFPFLAVSALEKRLNLSHKMLDRPMDNRAIMLDGREGIVGEWGMETLKPSYEGNITLRRALEVSKIAANVRLGKEVGLGQVMETARKFGLDFPETRLLARMLVGTEDASLPQIVQAYAAFPNKGKLGRPLYFIDQITDIGGTPRYTSPTNDLSKVEPSILPEHAFLTHSVLQGSYQLTAKQNGSKEITPGLAGKTGSTYDFADNWYVGYNSRVTCAVWTGFLTGQRNAIYPAAFSRETVFPAWQASMSTALNSFPNEEITPPANVVPHEVCTKSGLRKTRYCQQFQRNEVTGEEGHIATTRIEFFVKGAEPMGYCDVHGAGDGTLGVHQALHTGASVKKDPVYTIPIQPKAPLLLGSDPYGTEQPDFAPRDQSADSSNETLNFDQLEQEDDDASIFLDKPKRTKIAE